jgi:hypothetical protein
LATVLAYGEEVIYGQFMTTRSDLITAAEATSALGFKNRSSLTRLVQRGDITPAFRGSGKTGEQFFRPEDIARILAERAA